MDKCPSLEAMLKEIVIRDITRGACRVRRVEFDRYRYTDTDISVSVRRTFKPIPISPKLGCGDLKKKGRDALQG